MQGGVHDFQAGGFGNGVMIQDQGLDGCHILVVNLLANGMIQTGGHGVVMAHGFHSGVIGDGVHLVQDLFVQGSGHLGAVVPIDLVAVVGRGVVGGGNHDAGGAAQGTGGKGQHGHRPQGVKPVGGDAVGIQAQGGLFGKLRGHVPGVKGDGYAFSGGALLQNEVGQALGGLPDGIEVHAVATGPQNAPQTAGAKGQVPIEPVFDFLGVPGLGQGPQLGPGGLVKIGVVAPLLKTFHCIHINHLHNLF